MKTSLAVRIGLTVIVAFLTISVLAFGVMFRRSDLNAEVAFPEPGTVAAIAALLDGLPSESREALILALSSPLLQISITPISSAQVSPATAPELDELGARYRAAMPKRDVRLGTWGEPYRLLGLIGLLRNRHANIDLRVGLKNGDWLILRSQDAFPMNAFGLPLGFGAGLMGTIIALLMLVFLLRQIRPLEELARAVDHIDLRDDPKPIPEVRSSAPEIRAVVAAFNRQQERLSRLLKSRLALVGGLQHDVRTFATKVRLRLESANGSASLDRAIADLDDMVRLLDDALLATQGTEASTKEALELVDIRELLLLEKDARPEQKIALQTTPDGANDRIYVLGNRLALRRVFSNLIDNAVAYGHEARIGLATTAERVIATIDDCGPGIPIDMRGIVREPFVRLEQSRARATGGSGLGLAIVSNLVTRHDGCFTISDAPGGGARMIIDLPRFRADRAD